MRAALRTAALAAGALLLALQLVPYGRDHSNPPVTQDAPWPTAEGRRLAVSACYGCHSNETKWPIYSQIAPISWWVQHDVEEGRQELNFSTGHFDAGEAADAVERGFMPPREYTLLHPDARLSAAQKAALIQELQAMGAGRGGSGSNRGRG